MKTDKKYLPLLAAVSFAVLTAVLMMGFACSPKKEKMYVIGYINPNPDEEEGAQGFLRNMPKFGYSEGKNITYIKCESKDAGVMETAVRDMISKKVDLIFAMTTPATKIAKELTEGTNIPVVFVMYDAVKSGIIKSFVQHDGNLTGVQIGGSTQKALEWLSAIAPRAKRIYVPVCFDTGAAKQSLSDLRESAGRLGYDIIVSEVKTVEELHAALSSMPQNSDAVFMLHTWLVSTHLDAVLEAAKKRKIPVVSAGHVHYDNGLVLSYGPRDNSTGTQAARLAHNILKGIPPSNLPVERSEYFLGINLKTALATGMNIPDAILQQADDIIR